MGKEITISIDNHDVPSQEGASIIEAADKAGIYIPRLCYRPDVPPGPGTKANGRIYRSGELIAAGGAATGGADDAEYHGCNLCIVEIAGRGDCQACATLAQEGMVIASNTPRIWEKRKESLARIIALHPHACLSCSERSGCDRGSCTQGVIKNARCCSKFDNCEFQRVSESIKIRNDVAQYIFRDLPVSETSFFTLDPNLCVGCARCVRACQKVSGKQVMGFVFQSGEFIIGTAGTSHKESGCVFCGACVAVCPTGALMDKGLPWKKKAELKFAPVILPPEDDLELTEENVKKVPEINGVYQLFDEKQEAIYIRGADNIRKDLEEKWQSVEKARFFRYEEHGMYTMRENEMLEKHLKKYGKLPEVNNEISDLY